MEVMTTTTHAAHGRRQLLFLACVCALVAQAGLGLLAYQTLSATPIVVAGLIGYGVGESIASIVTVGVALHYLHPTLSWAQKILGAAVVGVILASGVTGLEAVEDAPTAALTALHWTGSALGLLSTGLFWAAVFAGEKPTCLRWKSPRG